jgi:hypothetical protein
MNAASNLLHSESNTGIVGSLQHRLVRQFKVQVADWQDTGRELTAWEDRHLLDSPSSECLAEHAAMLDELERLGRWLTEASRQAGFDDTEVTEQIQLTLQDLQDSRAMWHGQVSDARQREILRDCFDEF